MTSRGINYHKIGGVLYCKQLKLKFFLAEQCEKTYKSDPETMQSDFDRKTRTTLKSP
jgi:hypothetical protein